MSIVILLAGCGLGNQARAKELVKQACALEGSGGVENPRREPLIRQAVDLDEKYRPYLIAYLKWNDANWTMRNIEDPAISAQAYEDGKENFLIYDSYCN